MQLETARHHYLLDCQSENKSDHTVRWYDSKLRYFIRWVEDNHKVTDADDLGPSRIKDFLRALREQKGRRGKMSSLTVHGYAQVIQTFCHWLVENQYTKSPDPWRGIQMPKVEQVQIKAFTTDDINAMLDAVQHKPRNGQRDFAIIWVLFDTAIRASELLKLTLDDVDFQGSQLVIHGKGLRMRTVSIGRQTHRALHNYIHHVRGEPFLPSTQEVFLNERGEPLTLSGLWRIVKLAGEKAGITGKRLSPHTIRHAGAESMLRDCNFSAFHIQKALGHSTLNTSRLYVDLVEGDLKELYRRGGPGDHLRRRKSSRKK